MSLKVEAISFSYDQGRKKNIHTKWILDHFTADFERGEITAVTGPNGCGKTTLSKLLVGILKPTTGIIRLDDTDLKGWSLAEIGVRIGYIMQNPNHQLFCTSVYEEILYGLNNMNLDLKEKRERAEEYLNYFELNEKKQEFPYLLSHGEKQRVVLAAVLAMRPRFLVLDEPTASLDLHRQKLLGEYLMKIKEDQNCGIIFISHDREFIQHYADSEIRMP